MSATRVLIDPSEKGVDEIPSLPNLLTATV
jgi:hypothetical protein